MMTLAFRLRLLLMPMAWPVRSRRYALVGLPLSLPLWLCAIVGLSLAIIAESLLFAPVSSFWNAPPVVLRRRDGTYHDGSGYAPAGLQAVCEDKKAA